LYGAELGGPEVGRGCGGRGISFGFGLLEERGMANWALDYIVMDFLGDVVCGGFATPIAKSLAEEIVIIASHDRMSLYAANNIARAVNYFQTMGGSTRVIGMVLNRDDGSGVAEKFAERVGLPILVRVPFSPPARMLSDRCKLLFELPEMDHIFDQFVNKIHHRDYTVPDRVAPLEYDEFLDVFGAAEPPGVPDGASMDELMGRATIAAHAVAVVAAALVHVVVLAAHAAVAVGPGARAPAVAALPAARVPATVSRPASLLVCRRAARIRVRSVRKTSKLQRRPLYLGIPFSLTPVPVWCRHVECHAAS